MILQESIAPVIHWAEGRQMSCSLLIRRFLLQPAPVVRLPVRFPVPTQMKRKLQKWRHIGFLS